MVKLFPLFRYLPRSAVHDQRILAGLTVRQSGAGGREGSLHFLVLCPGRHVGKAVVIIDLCCLGTGTVDPGGEAIDAIHSTMAEAEVSVSGLGGIGRPGGTALLRQIVVV